MEPHHLSTCSTLLNVPLKLMRKDRIQKGFGLFSFNRLKNFFLDILYLVRKSQFTGQKIFAAAYSSKNKATI